MANVVTPGLLQDVRKYGRFDATACLNCGTCTVTCNLAGNSAPFPRRPIQYAILGLKEPLRKSLEPWLCHDCGDCSKACPQQAEPRESMMTLRRYLTAQYDVTRLASKIQIAKKWGIIAMTLLFLLVFALVVVYHIYYVEMDLAGFASTPMPLGHMFNTITYFTYTVYLLPLLLMLLNAVRMQRLTMRGSGIPFRYYRTEFKTMVLHAATHKKIRECAEKVFVRRWIKHWLMAFACILMCVITFFFLEWFQTDEIYPVYHPQRWLGYLATAILILIPIDILVGRTRKRKEIHRFSELSDWTFPVLLLLTALSGIAVHIFRYAGFELSAHYAYALHLAIVVPLFLIEIPFGKWSHMIYRPLAIYFEAVRESAAQERTTFIAAKEAAA